ncbi:prolyl endopeptidase-like protein [Rhizoclosmatium globosum]|uniref:Prolyl endopeptidase n=1 Tax=Rhizoclosmatium globosum TaxID=329046 RepID=A0A1Y2C291_9FUNG|nr:prolyl endopeptidase-like protein [Rhizoclosmatium globosum]|eukprot:ORY40997.1 prolyl endopeptidase-like protein [Rhizoclosmatium globosum]
MTKFAYPAVRRDENHVDVLHGVPVKHRLELTHQSYRHLEDPDAPETKAFVEAQNSLFQGFIKDSAVLRGKIEAKLTEMYNYERFGVPFKKGDNYYYFHNSGLQPQSVLYTQKSVDATASVFFDSNKLSDDGTVSLSTYRFSEKGNLFAYALSASGSDWVKIHVREVGADKDLEEKPLEWAKFTGISWTHDEKGFFYNRYQAPSVSLDKAGTETDSAENQMVYYHRIGTSQSEDILIHKDASNPTHMFGVSVSDCGRYLILTVSESCDPKNLVYVADLQKQFGTNSVLGVPTFSPIVDKWEAEFSCIANEGTTFFFETTLNAPKKRILGFVEVVAETENPLDFNNVVDENKLVLVYLKDVKHVMKVYELHTGAFLNDIEMPSGSIIKGMSGNRKDTEMFYSFGSFVSPGITRHSIFRETSVKGFNSSIFEVKQVFYSSEDGTKIPMSVIEWHNPALLYAYGGFNISFFPLFFVAVANIRGGAEYGQEWYDSGVSKRSKTVLQTFSMLPYTKPERLQSTEDQWRTSRWCVCNQTPELFGLGIAEVGVMDLLRFHKFTIGSAWTSDYGNPDVKEDFEYALKISPLHNVDRNKKYPLYSGHGAGKSMQQIIEEASDKYTYLARVLNANYSD